MLDLMLSAVSLDGLISISIHQARRPTALMGKAVGHAGVVAGGSREALEFRV